MPPVSLPVLTTAPGKPLRITPTDVSSFVRLEQCERFLRFRLAERAGVRFMDDYGVAPQRLARLLSLSGREFEEGVEKDIAAQVRAVHFPAKYSGDHNRPANNTEVVAEVKSLPTLHAWVTDGQGRAIDNTWPQPGVAYAGVPFTSFFVNMTALKNHATISLLDDFQNNYPLRADLGDRPDEWLEPRGRGTTRLNGK